MHEKKRRRRPGQYTLPPHVAETQRKAARRAGYKPGPQLPRRRLIATHIGFLLLTAGMVALFWLPSRALVHDLRSHGSIAHAKVTAVDNKPKYVKVKFASGPELGITVDLSDYAGMYPDLHEGDSVLVSYDPGDPSRILTASWVSDPPVNWPLYGASTLTAICLAMTVTLVLRRRWVLKNWPPDPPAGADGSEATPVTPVPLTKPQP